MDVSSSTDIPREVLALIENAKEFLLLVSPYPPTNHHPPQPLRIA